MKLNLHKHLNSKIWDKNDTMKTVVSDMLLSIAWAYIDYIRNEYNMPIRNSDISDIFVFGSTTQLFYNKKSDIDICIVLNLDYAQQQFPNMDIANQLKLYYYDWAMVHICKIYGHKIDLNFSNVKTPEYNGRHRRGPMYSILHNEWIFRPIPFSSEELNKIEQQSKIIYKQILRDYKQVKKNGFKLNEINKLYNNIITSKTQSLREENERVINPVYMAIREFKYKGYINILRKHAIQKETEKYVLK